MSKWIGVNSMKIYKIDWHALGSHDSEVWFDPKCKKCKATKPNLDKESK